MCTLFKQGKCSNYSNSSAKNSENMKSERVERIGCLRGILFDKKGMGMGWRDPFWSNRWTVGKNEWKDWVGGYQGLDSSQKIYQLLLKKLSCRHLLRDNNWPTSLVRFQLAIVGLLTRVYQNHCGFSRHVSKPRVGSCVLLVLKVILGLNRHWEIDNHFSSMSLRSAPYKSISPKHRA